MDIYRKVLQWLEEGRSFAMGTVVSAEGSTPQKAGCKTLLDSDANQTGTLGGGLVEADGLRRISEAITSGNTTLYEFALDEDYSREAGPICGGVMRLFTNPKVAQNADAYRQALGAIENRERGVLITTLSGDSTDSGIAQWIPSGNGAELPNAEAIERSLRESEPTLTQASGGEDIFIEPVVPRPRLLIVGAGHVGQAIALQCAPLGFEITVYDDRAELTRAELFPEGVQTGHGDLRELVGAFPKDADTYIVLVSKGHRPDAEALEACIHSTPAYLGMIGSKRKIRFLRKHFLEDGLATQEEWDRVVAPIGYKIGAVTVPEIGISIAAQLIAARRLPHAVRDITPSAIQA